MIQTGDRNFWKAQLIGWGIMSLTNLMVQALAGVQMPYLLSNFLLPFVLGIGVTSAYRYLIKYRKVQVNNLGDLTLWVLVSTIVLLVGFLVSLYLATWALMPIKLNLVRILNNGIIFGIVLLCWNMIYFCVQYFNRWSQAEVEKWKLVAEMKEAQLGALKSQVNPHFVFNTLNNIRALIREDSEKARDMLLNFSDLFRYSLQKTQEDQVPLADEIEIVRQYLELVSIQYEDKLRYEIEMNPQVSQLPIPPMMLQLLVENAIKHGISQFNNGGEVLVKVNQAPGFLHLEVRNTGSLQISSSLGQKLGVGLKNIRERLAILYNGQASLQQKEEAQQVITTIQIPLA